MCGFAGYIHNYGTFDKEEVIHKMADRIKHRGPDDAHYYIDDGIALGFRRLSIIDLEGGRQPILNEDGSLVLLFNGEIYNYQELREELIKAGHVFTTKTDSETILHGYEEYGKKILHHLEQEHKRALWCTRYFRHQAVLLIQKGQGIHVRQRDQKLSLSPEF